MTDRVVCEDGVGLGWCPLIMFSVVLLVVSFWFGYCIGGSGYSDSEDGVLWAVVNLDCYADSGGGVEFCVYDGVEIDPVLFLVNAKELLLSGDLS